MINLRELRPRAPTVTAFCILALLSLNSAAASAENLADRLLSTLLHENTEGQLYQQANNPWPGGSYKLQVFKNGKPSMISSANDIQLQMPLRVFIVGDATNSLLKVELACTAEFNTVARLGLTPKKGGGPSLQLQSQVHLPIPMVTADCGGMQLPIQAYLQVFIEQNKPKWEHDIDAKVNGLLNGQVQKQLGP